MNTIINPTNNNSYSIFSNKGKELLKQYITQINGGLVPERDENYIELQNERRQLENERRRQLENENEKFNVKINYHHNAVTNISAGQGNFMITKIPTDTTIEDFLNIILMIGENDVGLTFLEPREKLRFIFNGQLLENELEKKCNEIEELTTSGVAEILIIMDNM